MGFFKKLTKGVSKAFGKLTKLTGKVTGVDWLTDRIKSPLQDMFGITAQKDAAMRQEAEINRQGQAAKLEAANEMSNITQFDDTDTSSYVSSGARRKRKTGAFSSGVSLNY